ncbi:MAG: T9SS type A sorting domain-containing protein [Bacteroidota bacterium]|nr:T9SS type A sorting domain-containing protein [Bacteroidota bacterium]
MIGSSFQAILQTEYLGCTDVASISISYYPGINYGDGADSNISNEGFNSTNTGFDKTQISIYPNLAKDKLSIFSNALNYPLEIRIYTLDGRIAGTYKQNSLHEDFNINLESGQYIIESIEINGDKHISKCLIPEN